MSVQARRARPMVVRGTGGSATELGTAAHAMHAITLEAALYLGVVVAGAVLRLLLLDLRPLSVEEGRLAAESYHIWQAQPPASLHQGLLEAYGTALMLGMFAGGDGAARLLPALFGSALVGTPYLLRRSLGRGAALLSTCALALSPLMVFASLDVGSGVIPLTLGLLLWWAVEPGLKGAGVWRAGIVALLLSALVASGPAGISLGLALGLAALLSHPRVSSLAAELVEASRSTAWRRAAVVFVASLLALGAGFGTYLPGVQWAVADIWAAWARSFTLAMPRDTVLVLLALYELPVLVLGAVQLVRAIVRRDRVDTFLALWVMILLLMGMVQGTGQVARALLPLLPLYLLSARLVADGLSGAKGWEWSWSQGRMLLLLLVPILAAALMMNAATLPGNERLVPFIVWAVAAIVVGEMGAAVWLWYRDRGTLVWYMVVLLAGLFMVHTTAFLNLRMDSLAREPVVGSQVSPSLRDVGKDAAYFSTYFYTPVTVDPQLQPATEWYLRSARDVQYSTESAPGISFQLSQPGQGLDPGSERRPGTYTPAIAPGDLTWKGIWRWLAGRDGLVRPNQSDVVIRAPEGSW